MIFRYFKVHEAFLQNAYILSSIAIYLKNFDGSVDLVITQ